ncbi:MAG: group II intron reverse transcriptase/maturase [Bacteroidota bacterium]
MHEENGAMNKKGLLRNNEYYQMQEIFDDLYKKSENNANFKNLMPIITSSKNIRLAFRNLKTNKGSKTPGVDGKTIDDLKALTTEKLIECVKIRLSSYNPHMIRRVYIEKENGKKRPLGIPTIEDRLVQQCIKQVLEPICEVKFHNHSYGFRPNRSTHHAIARVKFLINKAKLKYAVSIDIKGFFDNVNHSKLMKQLWTTGIRDKNLLSIMNKSLSSEIQGEGIPTKGTIQGGLISPLLANVVLNELDWWLSDQFETFKTEIQYSTNGTKSRALINRSNLKRFYIVRYADDLTIMCEDYETANKIKIATTKWLKERLKLEVNESKTKITNLRTNYMNFLGFRLKTVKKGHRYVCKSKMSIKAFNKAVKKLKAQVIKVQQTNLAKEVNKLNAMILGLHNYYKVATHVNIDFSIIAFLVNKTLENRLKCNLNKKGHISKTFKKYYGKYNFKAYNVCKIRLFPIGGIKFSIPYSFIQTTCNYKASGRAKIHSELQNVNSNMFKYMLANPIRGQTIEFNDNTLSKTAGQQGRCFITKDELKIGQLKCIHQTPKKLGGSDNYKNIIIVSSDVYKLIHEENERDQLVYMRRIGRSIRNKIALKRLNRLRKIIGNSKIMNI